MNNYKREIFKVEKEEGTVDKHGRSTDQLTRENWDTWDPMLISEGLFAAANIFSNLKLVYIFSVNPYLGPLQVHQNCILKLS